jgi:hypothetical protein
MHKINEPPSSAYQHVTFEVSCKSPTIDSQTISLNLSILYTNDTTLINIMLFQ